MVIEQDIELTRQAFDAAAPVYDAAYEGLPGIRRMRSITSGLYMRYFPGGSRLLEINCGTGNDAVFLARRGMHVTATDISPAMLNEVRKKTARLEGVAGSIETRLLPFDRLGELRGESFDGGYSNLGGLNCTDRLATLAHDLGDLLKPGGIFIATVMPPFCAWETAAFLARGRFRKAFRRLSRKGTIADLHGGHVRTFYHSPGTFRRAFSRYFEQIRTLGLAVFIPPPNFTRASSLTGLLGPVDDVLAGLPLLRSIGDHYSIVLRRKS
ncbi:MAG TPA: class I SAM-dependent methyltransferase [Bacteroidota bacterium]|nr:class I SAM-dependent methyltransferase [Bacteroidota bacterium]